ncbi:MAG: divalent-cation tolerance protein CutA [Proteobacteria bacterium]|nr:divalent-cation tolerance protein CutA [Pseudomonadota bacterium]
MTHVVMLYTTWPDAETAERASAEAVAQRLAACANILGPMRSIYRWNGAVEQAAEMPVLFKTTAAQAEALSAFLAGRHPYETPAILAFEARMNGSHPPFLKWVTAEVGNPDPDGIV